MRNFVSIGLGNEAAPDETTICRFRHLIESKGLSKMMLTARWSQACCMVRRRRFGATLPIRVRQKRSGLLTIKQIFGFTHVRYRGLTKNGTRFEVLCALANLYIKRRVLMRCFHA